MIYPTGMSLPSPILFALLPRTTAPFSVHSPPVPLFLTASSFTAPWFLLFLSLVSPRKESFRESRAFWFTTVRYVRVPAKCPIQAEARRRKRKGEEAGFLLSFISMVASLPAWIYDVSNISFRRYFARAVIGTSRRELSRGGWEEERETNF